MNKSSETKPEPVGYAAHGAPLIPGRNVDRVDYDAGLTMLAKTGWDDPFTQQVILHALQRWARGEEAAAERAAIDRTFHGIDFTSWRMVLAAATEVRRYCKQCGFYTDHVSTAHDGLAARGLLLPKGARA